MTSKDIKGLKIHESSEVQSLEIGTGTTIWQFCVILARAKIGTNCNINCHVFIEHDVVIGNNVTVKSGVQIWDGVTLGDDVFIGPNVTFTNDLVPRSKVYPEKYLLTHIDNGASIGANATIVSGISIGKYAVIGAGSVVTKDIPGYTLWYGNPAKHHGYVTKEGEILDLNYISKKSGTRYTFVDGEFIIMA
jgi:UDP-2-acetamido-3-amino-2,3-dideoxy-glucuronate N-acetyltransferase